MDVYFWVAIYVKINRSTYMDFEKDILVVFSVLINNIVKSTRAKNVNHILQLLSQWFICQLVRIKTTEMKSGSDRHVS